MSTMLTGTRPLMRTTIRQNARLIAPWVVLISVLSASSILAYHWIFPSAAERESLAATLGSNPALTIIFGPARDLLTADGFNAWRAGQLGALFASLMAITIVIRNSRADEDSGQAELISSGVITRQARLAVPIAIATIAALALGVVCFLLTWLSGGGVLATFTLSTSFAAIALVFTGVAAVAAQLGAEARTASSLAIGTMGALYIARGYIDSSQFPDWAGWLTPFGWIEKMAPATDNNLWPLLACLGCAAILVILAMILQEHRDFGLGMISPRPGPSAAPHLGIFRLAAKLHRTSLVTWLIGFAVLGLIFGNLATTISDVFASNPAIAKILASGATTSEELTFGFVATILQIVGIIAAIMGAQIIMHVYAEEVSYRVEPLLASALRRRTYLASNVIVALVAEALAMITAGTVMGFVASHRQPSIHFLDVFTQAVVTIPAVWILTAISVAAIGAKPSRRLVGWLVIVATFGITLLGPTFKLPNWALGVSPLHHVPIVTGADPHWCGVGVLCLIAVAFLSVGFAGFRQRDIL